MAIDELLDEHEQSERVREWLRRNGSALFIGVALGLAAIGGWQWWQRHQEQQQDKMASDYQAALDAIEAKDKAADGRIKALPEGVFRTLAQLALAKSQVEAGQRDEAIATLRSIRTQDAAIAAIVNERLARVLIDAGQADAALKLVADSEWVAAMEVRGDAQMAMGQRDQARDTYSKALIKAEVGSPQRRLLELKLAEAGGTAPTTEAQS